MRFRDIRKSVVKKTWMDEGNFKYHEIARPQRISAYDEFRTPRVAAGDIHHPTHNRASRRSAGNVKSRNRTRGTTPPHPIAVINAARRIENQGIRDRAKKARQFHRENAK